MRSSASIRNMPLSHLHRKETACGQAATEFPQSKQGVWWGESMGQWEGGQVSGPQRHILERPTRESAGLGDPLSIVVYGSSRRQGVFSAGWELEEDKDHVSRIPPPKAVRADT